MKGTFIVSIICMALAVTFAATLDMQLAASAKNENRKETQTSTQEATNNLSSGYEVSQAN